MEINIIFPINTNSSPADRKKGTNLDISFRFYQKKQFLILEMLVSQLATWQFKDVLTEENRDGKQWGKLAKENRRQMKRRRGSYMKTQDWEIALKDP